MTPFEQTLNWFHDNPELKCVKPEEVLHQFYMAGWNAAMEACREESEASAAQLATAKQVIESDRTKIAVAVTGLKQAIASRSWLARGGRGSYEWNDARYQQEFADAVTDILEAVKPFERLAADLSNSPQTSDEVVKARMDLTAQLECVTKERERCARTAQQYGVTKYHDNGATVLATGIAIAEEIRSLGPTLALDEALRKARDGAWRLVRDLNGNRLLESQSGNAAVVIVLEPNLDRSVSWLLGEMESMAQELRAGKGE